MVFAEAVEGADQAAADYQADGEAEGDAEPDLLDEAFVEGVVVGGAEGLLEEGEEDGDDDAGFEAFAEADEEDWLFMISKSRETKEMDLKCEMMYLALRIRLAPFLKDFFPYVDRLMLFAVL